jgi:hypothetical protein
VADDDDGSARGLVSKNSVRGVVSKNSVRGVVSKNSGCTLIRRAAIPTTHKHAALRVMGMKRASEIEREGGRGSWEMHARRSLAKESNLE